MMKKINKFLFILLLIGMLAGIHACMKGPNFQKPEEVPTLASFRYDSTQTAETDSLLNIKWWELFDDPILDTLIADGLRANKDILIASSRIQQSRAAVGYVKADQWPRFDYSVGIEQANFFNGVPIEGGASTSLFTGFGSLSWELDFWGKFKRTTEAARAEMLASEFGLRTVQIGLISQISGTYFLLLDYQWRLEISRNTLRLRKESLDIIEARYTAGIIPEIDVNQAQIQMAIAATAIPIFERKVAQTENALSILLGKSPGPIIAGQTLDQQSFPPAIPSGLPSQLLARRPDILQMQELAHAQTARIGVAEAMRFPSINLTALFGIASTDLSALTAGGPAWSAGVGLLGPIFNFSKNKKRVEIERLKTEQILVEYDRTVLIAFREVEDALIEIHTLKKELEARQMHVNAARNALGLSKERYDKGVTSFLELLESQRQAFEAELKLSEVTQLLFNGYIKLYKALGGGWISEAEMANASTLNPAAE